jgi:hypothetical protein
VLAESFGMPGGCVTICTIAADGIVRFVEVSSSIRPVTSGVTFFDASMVWCRTEI